VSGEGADGPTQRHRFPKPLSQASEGERHADDMIARSLLAFAPIRRAGLQRPTISITTNDLARRRTSKSDRSFLKGRQTSSGRKRPAIFAIVEADRSAGMLEAEGLRAPTCPARLSRVSSHGFAKRRMVDLIVRNRMSQILCPRGTEPGQHQLGAPADAISKARQRRLGSP
jgi:hypothetical protein